MIFRQSRYPPMPGLKLAQTPIYLCRKCDVTGAGSVCWCCNSTDVEPQGRLLTAK